MFRLCCELWTLLRPNLDVEIVIVDDCSTDGTISEVERARSFGVPLTIIRNDYRLGLGASIGIGVKSSKSDFVAVMDSDFTHSPDDLSKMVLLLSEHDFVFGSRFSQSIAHDGLPTYIASRLYQQLLRPVLKLPFRDILGGFWVTNRRVLETVPSNRVFLGYGDYFFRLLSSLVRGSVSILEFSATYRERSSGQSKSKPLQMMFTYLFRAVRWRVKTSPIYLRFSSK
jgi:glycosyltransferase involved in cell wall biosynthesis